MQNKQTTSIKYISQNLHASYRQFLTELTTAAEAEVPLLPQMPHFQRTLFLDQAQTKHYAVMLQMNPAITQTHPYNIHGQLKTLASGQLVLINRGLHVTHLIDVDQIRYLKRV
ncbi:hypothetical protein [Lactiplantibacillus daowaiensis]|uniref:Uncharacterized protein n=1 Tax=Lactiplantibacillus daowaiensis TaxID=2559918 RepID=A0ABW1S2S6_9LACO